MPEKLRLFCMRLLLIVSLLFLLACKNRAMEAKKTSLGLHDSLISLYVSKVDSFDFFDTTEYNFRILRAYINKDSSFFKQMMHDVYVAATDDYPLPDSCVLPKKISDLSVDEAYRFTHKQSSCHFGQTITVTKRADTIELHYVEYIPPSVNNWREEITFKNGAHYVTGENCIKIREIFKELTRTEWETFEQKLDEADYWGLNTRNMRSGLDGSDWVIDGYIKNPGWNKKQIHRVIRWSPENFFMDLGKYFLKLSGQTTLCGDMR
jgi:hypothetical protein